MVDRISYILDRNTVLPVNNWWVENPFSSNVVIKNRRAGYLPQQTFNVITPVIQKECPMMFQTSPDIILPRNLCYAKYKTIINQPEDDDD
jgi:hypothetical protein